MIEILLIIIVVLVGLTAYLMWAIKRLIDNLESLDDETF